MASSVVFEWVCEEFERSTALDRLEARGTVRIALKQAGLDAAALTREQIAVVLERVLPGELRDRGIDDAERVCQEIAGRLGELPESAGQVDTPEAVFQRLGG